jgi:hypothetical protein
MTVVAVVLLLACVALAVFAVAIVIRADQVYEYRTCILATIANQIPVNPYDIDWRIEAYKRVTYNEMVLKIWKPLDSFYPDKSFLDLNEVRGHAPWEKTA